MLDNLDISVKLETPLTIETKTNGIAINLSKLTNIIPPRFYPIISEFN